jgi:hypothetical protein
MAEPGGPIDLRSDTVTRPSPGMRRAMAEAPVGDDQYGEDPSVNRLQQRIAELLGKEAGLFVPSGTMSNQIALKLLTRPGDEVILGEDAHMIWHEAGAGVANSGVLFTAVGRGGLFTAADFRAALKPPGHIVLPPTGLVAVENTHNLGRCRKGSAARSAACSPASTRQSRAPCAPAACSAARCGNPASLPPRGFMRSTIMWRGLAKTTPMPG